jgi:hypothetical protein
MHVKIGFSVCLDLVDRAARGRANNMLVAVTSLGAMAYALLQPYHLRCEALDEQNRYCVQVLCKEVRVKP